MRLGGVHAVVFVVADGARRANVAGRAGRAEVGTSDARKLTGCADIARGGGNFVGGITFGAEATNLERAHGARVLSARAVRAAAYARRARESAVVAKLAREGAGEAVGAGRARCADRRALMR